MYELIINLNFFKNRVLQIQLEFDFMLSLAIEDQLKGEFVFFLNSQRLDHIDKELHTLVRKCSSAH